MSIIVNVDGKLKELYRVFFNDNGVIREFDSVYTRIKSGETKLLFERDQNTQNMPYPLSWVTGRATNAPKTVFYSITNNGYSLRACFSLYRRTHETRDKIYLPAGTLIKVEVSNIKYDMDWAKYPCIIMYLFDEKYGTEPYQAASIMGQSLTMNVKTSGNYYFSPNVIGYGVPNPTMWDGPCVVTANINISITLP